MTLFDREFIADFFKTFFTLLALMAILFFGYIFLDFFQEAAEGVGIHWVFLLYVCRLPHFFVDTGVVLSSAAILWNVVRRARSNEILAYLAGGISPARLAAPFIASALLVSVIDICLNEFVVSESDRTAVYIEGRWIKNKALERVARPTDIFQKWGSDRVYIINFYNPANKTMNEPTIIDLWPSTGSPRTVLHAARATLDDSPEGKWTFQQASVREMDEKGRMVRYKEYDEISDKALSTPLSAQVADFLDHLDEPGQMNVRELARYINLLDQQGKPISQYRFMLHNKLALPLAVTVVALAMCAHVLRPRSLGVLVDFGGGLMIIVLYYGLLMACTRSFKDSAGLSVVVLAWLPNAVFALAAIGLFLKRAR